MLCSRDIAGYSHDTAGLMITEHDCFIACSNLSELEHIFSTLQQ